MTESEDLYFTLGFRKADVSRIQGPPESTRSDDTFEGENWFYAVGGHTDVVSFNRAGRVEGWSNNTGSLRARTVPSPTVTTAASFQLGSHKDDVARLEGTPFRIIAPIRRTRASIREERRLNRDLGITPDLYDEIIENNISGLNDDSDRETWHFRGGTVELSVANGRVTAWHSIDSSFNTAVSVVSRASTRKTDTGHFGIGSTKEDVVRLQGQPRSTLTREIVGEEDWTYPGGTVKFESADGNVIYWENRDNSLRTKGIRPYYPVFRESNFIRDRKARIETRRLRQKKETNRFAFGCVGILVVAIALLWVVCYVGY